MDKIVIRGGRPLAGEVTIAGAKNAALLSSSAAGRSEWTAKSKSSRLRAGRGPMQNDICRGPIGPATHIPGSPSGADRPRAVG